MITGSKIDNGVDCDGMEPSGLNNYMSRRVLKSHSVMISQHTWSQKAAIFELLQEVLL